MRSVMSFPTHRFAGAHKRGALSKSGRHAAVRRLGALRRDASHALETRVGRGRRSTRKLPWIGRGFPTARRAKRNKPLRCRPLEGRRDQKSPFVVALSCVPRGERGSPVSPPAAGCCRGPVLPPGCRPEGIHPLDHRSFKTPGGCPAVGRMPTNRHAATGTCEIGQGRYTGEPVPSQGQTAGSAQKTLSATSAVAETPRRMDRSSQAKTDGPSSRHRQPGVSPGSRRSFAGRHRSSGS